jgi:uncharacterized protein
VIAYKLNGFEYRDVELLDGICQRQRADTIAFYLKYPAVDDILQGSRKLAGIHTDADGMPGWGPSIGQYFGALAKLYRCTGDRRLYDKCMDIFSGWTECADACQKVLDLGTYMYEKFIGGLLDMAEYMGVDRARAYIWRLTIRAKEMFDTGIPRDGLQDERMKGPIEWYTLPENLYRAYQLFGDPLYKEFADEWLYHYLFDKIAAEDYKIGPRHAYSHVNCLSSAARAYMVTEDARYLDVIQKAYREIVAHHTYITGGYGPAEMLFGENDGYMGDMLKNTWELERENGAAYRSFWGGMVARSDAWGSCEVSCCAWAVFKICNYLIKLTGDARYGAWAESMLINGTLGQPPITPKGEIMYYANYFLDGAVKTVEDRRLTEGGGNHVWQCCTGTFPQDVAEYANMVFYTCSDGLYISQYIPAEVKTALGGQQITARILPRALEDQRAIIRLGMAEPARMKVSMRVPSWAVHTTVSVNGVVQDIPCAPDTWAVLDRQWHDGDEIILNTQYTLVFKAVDKANPGIMALSWEPLALVSDEMTILTGDIGHPEDWIKPVSGQPGVFETQPGHTGKYPFVCRRFSPYYSFPIMKWYYMYYRVSSGVPDNK